MDGVDITSQDLDPHLVPGKSSTNRICHRVVDACLLGIETRDRFAQGQLHTLKSSGGYPARKLFRCKTTEIMRTDAQADF